MNRPEGVSTWKESDFDNFKFIIHELFLYAISCLLKYECFDAVGGCPAIAFDPKKFASFWI